MAKRVNMDYAPFKTTTPKLESYYHNLLTPDDYNEKFDIGVVVDDSPECQAMIQQLLEFQNDCLTRDGRDAQDTLLNLKDEKAKDEATGKWTTPTGRQLLFFKAATRDRFAVVGADKKPMDAASISKGDTVRVNGQAAFGYMSGKPWVTLFLNAVQHISGGGASGVDAFDNEDSTGGETETPFEEETDTTMADLV